MSMTSNRLALLVATLSLALVSCGGDDDDTAVDSGTVVDGGTSGSCPFSGTYTLETYACGANDITAAWKTAIPTTTITFTSAGTGCKLTVVTMSTMCMETEEALVTSVGATASMMWTGITTCAPASCKHTANDAACVVGDRVRSGPASVLAEGAKIRLKYNFADNVCNGVETNIVLAR